MNKLGLVGGLVAVGTAFFLAAEKKANTKRDVLVRMLAQGLNDENYEGVQGSLLILARDYGHQADVRDCLITGIVEAGNIFGHARAIPFFDQIKQYARSSALVSHVDRIKTTLNDRSYSQAKAREQSIRSLSEFLRKSGLPQIDFGEGPVDFKRQATAPDALQMSPAQFMKYYDRSDDVAPQPSLRLR